MTEREPELCGFSAHWCHHFPLNSVAEIVTWLWSTGNHQLSFHQQMLPNKGATCACTSRCKLNSLTKIIYSAGALWRRSTCHKDHTSSCQNTAIKFLANYHLIVPRSSPQAQQHDTVNPDYNHHHFHKKWHKQVFQFPGHSEYRSFSTKCRSTCIWGMPHPENIWGCFLQAIDNPQQCNG